MPQISPSQNQPRPSSGAPSSRTIRTGADREASRSRPPAAPPPPWPLSKPPRIQPGFPLALLQTSIKVTNEAPVGMRAGLKRSYAWVTQDMIDTVPRVEWRQLLWVLCHLHSEAIASLRMHGLDDESCWRLEQILRESDVVPRAAPSTETASIIAAAGSVHYFRVLPETASACPQPALIRELPFLLCAESFVADYAGASSLEAAMRAPRPQYDRLPIAGPLPLPLLTAMDAAAASGGKGGGKGGGMPMMKSAVRSCAAPMAMACADGKSPSFCPVATATSVVGLQRCRTAAMGPQLPSHHQQSQPHS